MSDLVEKPVSAVLYRQSSLETRLSPVHLSDESDLESSDEEKNTDTNPKIVDYTVKSEESKKDEQSPTTFGKYSERSNEEKNKFQNELQHKLNKKIVQHGKKGGDDNQQSRPENATLNVKSSYTGIHSPFQDELQHKIAGKRNKNKTSDMTIEEIKPKKPVYNEDLSDIQTDAETEISVGLMKGDY
ncbi:hypothetical protein NQ318_012137 [Aromia moschata]|uniref:Uncharacterized protein n=1 Tax=Aromia moschata TaxID=1265417 RepID=A0AAV8YY67_9CUCU|nr:hypothetical protein NQ318_012137 [Aromia moschata]